MLQEEEDGTGCVLSRTWKGLLSQTQVRTCRQIRCIVQRCGVWLMLVERLSAVRRSCVGRKHAQVWAGMCDRTALLGSVCNRAHRTLSSHLQPGLSKHTPRIRRYGRSCTACGTS